MNKIKYKGYQIEKTQNFFGKDIWVVTKNGSNPLFTGQFEKEARDWIDQH
jgi:hypothetical protein